MEMTDYTILFELAMILLFTKLFGLTTKKLGLPQVVGSLIAGLLLGPCVLGWVHQSVTLRVIAELGVILIMFSAGLGTDLKELKRVGPISVIVAFSGVILPLGAGFAIGAAFNGGFANLNAARVLKCVFIGIVMTATSVSITVTTLKELGKLKTRAGTVILSAAVIDDIIGIVLLSVIIGLKDPSVKIWLTMVRIAVFFVLAVLAGFLIHYLFKWLDKKFPHTRRIPIFGLVVCFLYAFIGEKYFGVADVTGAFLAGIMLSGLRDTSYIDRKVEIGEYMFFGPIFFASIGVNVDFSNFSVNIIWFSFAFVAVAIAAKMLGCFLAAKAFKMKFGESAVVGAGMVARGEVCLIVLQKGIMEGFIGSEYLAMGVMLVIISSFLAPVSLKIIYGIIEKKIKTSPNPALDVVIESSSPVVFAPKEPTEPVAAPSEKMVNSYSDAKDVRSNSESEEK